MRGLNSARGKIGGREKAAAATATRPYSYICNGKQPRDVSDCALDYEMDRRKKCQFNLHTSGNNLYCASLEDAVPDPD